METFKLTEEIVEKAVQSALEEDLGQAGDITTQAVISPDKRSRARIFTRSPGVVAGLPLAARVFSALDSDVKVTFAVEEGSLVKEGVELLFIEGRARSLLTGERSALNFLGRLSGIATMTSRFIKEVTGFGVSILETRKTTPGLRFLEKYAVSVGGGENHRLGLFDRILLKENHFALAEGVGGLDGYRDVVSKAVAAARGTGPVSAEARSLEEAMAALEGGADIILLDNMTPGELSRVCSACKKSARQVGREVLFEASGGITMKNVKAVAQSGVDRISVGALTHSVIPIDLSMLIQEPGTEAE